jgi:UDP-N-acetylmuramyl pentapeptide phosphotransferase/UDP-N-acetylglucosamine-1-phosphate transferase
VQSLPLAVSFAVALAVAPAAVRSLREQGLVRENYRGRPVAFPAGIGIVAAALVAIVPLALVHKAGGDIWQGDEIAGAGIVTISEVIVYVLGVTLLGLLDDLVGSGTAGGAGPAPPRGWRGHVRAAVRGRFSTGALKAVGTLGLALFVLTGHGLDGGEYLLAVAVLVLATNLFNLLDLRPGRSIKALLLLGAGLTLGSLDADPLWTLGLFLGPIVVLLPLDLRERGMLGDTGSNAVGAVGGLWLILTLSATGQLVALALIAVATVYGEFRSISTLIERTPGLRHLDSLGRPQHA